MISFTYHSWRGVMKLEVKNIQKSFGEKKVLKGLSFIAEGGMAFGILGRNGAGKTTTIRIIMNVFPASSGEVLLNGEPINYKNVRFGYLPEERGLYPKKKIIDQLCYFGELKGMDHKVAQQEADRWLERLGMMEYRNKKLQTLSKGNQQKIQLITALIHDPDIVILDEPFSGLDPVNAMLLKEVVKETIQKGKIVLFSSHQMNYIEEFCQSIAILNEGKIAITGTLKDIKRQYPRNQLVVTSLQSEAILEAYPECSQVMDTGEILFTMSSEQEKNQIMRQLIDTFDIDAIRVYEPSLNDIFVQYTQNGETQ